MKVFRVVNHIKIKTLLALQTHLVQNIFQEVRLRSGFCYSLIYQGKAIFYIAILIKSTFDTLQDTDDVLLISHHYWLVFIEVAYGQSLQIARI